MTSVSPTATTALPSPRAAIFRALWSGWAASVPLVCIATIAVLATPHARGIGFFPALRHAVLAPACIAASVASAFLYRALVARSSRPRAALALALGGAAVGVLAAMAALGSRGLASAAFPAVVAAALTLWWLVPRFVDQPRRSRAGTIAIAVVGALELAGVLGALSSERAAPPGPNGMAFEIPRAMFDVEHRFLDLPSGARVHYVDEGQGETLLFLHGNPSWSFQWRDLIRGLRGSYRCVALDYPGFGLSDAPAGFGFTAREESAVVEEFVDRLHLDNVTLVMQDWGGPIGIGLAERRPELVRGFVLGSTWAWPTSTGTPRGKFSVIMGGPVGEFLQMSFNSFARFGIENGVVHGLPVDALDVYLRPFRPVGRRGVAAFYPGQITAASAYFAEIEAALPRVADKKALFLWALRDRGFPREDLERFEKALPHHRTIELPGADHFFFEDTADLMISEIRAFVPPGPATPTPASPPAPPSR
jgi:pimeloyl-ACP methyl ester carboxylesterase